MKKVKFWNINAEFLVETLYNNSRPYFFVFKNKINNNVLQILKNFIKNFKILGKNSVKFE